MAAFVISGILAFIPALLVALLLTKFNDGWPDILIGATYFIGSGGVWYVSRFYLGKYLTLLIKELS